MSLCARRREGQEHLLWAKHRSLEDLTGKWRRKSEQALECTGTVVLERTKPDPVTRKESIAEQLQ